MPRPCKCRYVGFPPDFVAFKPVGIPSYELVEIVMTIDEIEAVRLADFEGLYQEQAAKKMKISRQTFGNIIGSARRKIADFLLNGKILRIEGGTLKMEERKFKCSDCQNEWAVPFGTPRPEGCPKCKSANFHREDSTGIAGPAGKGRGKGRCCNMRQKGKDA
jgi:uncharacterized protein